jgi:hypothetical protein
MKAAAAFVMACFAASILPAQQGKAPPIPDLTLPKDAAAQWTAGIEVFDANGLSPANSYLAASIPLLLQDELAGLESHAYSEEERALRRAVLLGRELLAVEKTVTAIRAERDAGYFNGVAPDSPVRAEVDGRLAAALARREFLLALDAAAIVVPEEKTASFKEGTGPGKLLDPQGYPAAEFADREGLDLLLGGSLREVQGYLLVDIWVFDALKRTVVFTAREAAQGDEIYASLPGIARQIAGTILGRTWSIIGYAPQPVHAALYVDGALVATGAASRLYLKPGVRQIRVSAPGYLDTTQSVELAPGAEQPFSITLQKETAATIQVSTEPQGADLYVGSLWKGRTPTRIDTPALRTRAVLTKSGFYDLPFLLAAGSPAELSFGLTPDAGSQSELQVKARDGFYTALGLFAASIPVPLACYAGAIDQALQRNNFILHRLPAAAASAQVGSNLFLGGYYAGIALSASLFTWMVLRIIDYVTASTGTKG